MKSVAALGIGTAMAGLVSTALSFLSETAIGGYGGFSAQFHGFPFWFLEYFTAGTNPTQGVYFDQTAFAVDLLMWSSLALTVLLVVTVVKRMARPPDPW